MQPSSKRILLNAEPFGFGPSAAIASFFPHVRQRFEHVGYIGIGHTLDLQNNLSYNELFDVSKLSDDEIIKIILQYDILVTAMDFDMARLAKKCGVKVIIYDALAWYWEKTSTAIETCDLYIAQDFFSVREKTENIIHTKIVPPIVGEAVERTPKYTLLNLGGLQNPLWSLEDVVAYASLITNAVRKVIPDNELLISTSKSVAKFLEGPVIQSFSREEMLGILSQTKCAFMTPGLGNIFDAARYGIPTVWLPPANTSQGQQALLLAQNGMVDAFMDWSAIAGDTLGYQHNQNRQPEYVSKLCSMIKNINSDEALKNKFESMVAESFLQISTKNVGAGRKLLEKFGTGGAEKTAELIWRYASE